MKHVLIITAYFFSTLTLLYTAPVRVNTIHTCILEHEVFEPISFIIGQNDAVIFSVKKDILFLEGIAIEIKRPHTAFTESYTVSYSFYTNIKPKPSQNNTDYTAYPLAHASLPNKPSHIIKIPLKKAYTFTAKNTEDILTYNEKFGMEPFMLKLSTDTIGTAETLKKNELKIIIRPLLIAEGALKFNFHFPDKHGKPISVQLNNRYISDFTKLHFIPPGTYLVNVNSNDYRSEMRSCIVEQGHITVVDIQLKSLIPLLHIQAPEHITVLIDGQETSMLKPVIPVTAGPHIIVFRLGHYEVTRQILAEEGKVYNIKALMNIIFEEAE